MRDMGRNSRLCFAILSVSLLGATTRQLRATVNDWPQFRGVHRDGRSADTGLLKEWPKEGPLLVWRINGLGRGYSGVSVAGDRIFTMGDRNKVQWVIALDRATGQEAWSTPIGAEWPDGGPRCTPTIDGQNLYALGPHGDLVCLTTDTGKLIWRKSLPQDFGGAMMSGWGYSESPLVDGDKLICTPGGKDAAMVALDKKNGHLLWKAALPDIGARGHDGAGYSSIVISKAGGIRQYVQMMGRGVVSVAADNGRFLWGYNRIANGTANITSPMVADDYVFCTTSYGTGSALLQLTSTSDKKGIQAHEVYFLEGGEFQNHHGGVVLVDGYLYGGHGQNAGSPTCIEMKTGKILWKQRGPGGGSASVTYADGHLYFRYEDGVMALIEATPKELKVKSTFKLPTHDGPSWPYPVIAGGLLYLRHGDSLLCYDLRVRQH